MILPAAVVMVLSTEYVILLAGDGVFITFEVSADELQ
jgi:hypothetical protein